MAATPLLSLIKKGTFITFQSAAEDMNNVFAQTDATSKFVFSKFALLNIPRVTDEQSVDVNSINFNNIEGHFVNGLNQNLSILERHRLDFCESFQNYLMNLETLIISSKKYDRNNPRTVTERIFFKWLKEIGAIRYQENPSQTVGDATLYSEEDSSKYSRVVQYVGEVDMQGSSSNTNENSFNEVYINVPSQAGNTPVILFKSIADNNYNEKTIVDNTSGELIKGRNKNQNPTAAGLTIEAIYDQDVHHGALSYDNNWYSNKGIDNNNCYYTDATFTDSSNDVIRRETTDKKRVHTYKRSRLDGVSIDFDLSDYKDVQTYNNQNSDQIKTFNQYNQLEKANNFEFNAILLYYNTYNVNDPSDSVTNLYGVLFVDDFKLDGNNAKIGTLSKIQQDNIINQQGNGIGFRLNFKFDVSSNTMDRKVEVSVNDYNTFSMQMFMEAMNVVSKMSHQYESLLLYNQRLIEQNKRLSGVIDTLNVPEFRAVIEQYRKTSSPDTDVTVDKLSSIVTKMSKTIGEILAGKTTVDVVDRLSVYTKSGITAELSDGTLMLENTRQRYSTIQTVDFDVLTNNLQDNTVTLGESDTLIIHQSKFDAKVAARNLTIRIDDTVGWKLGQTLTIVFSSPVKFMDYGIFVVTDAKNVLKAEVEYSCTAGIIPQVDADNVVITVTCIDPKQYKFIITCK